MILDQPFRFSRRIIERHSEFEGDGAIVGSRLIVAPPDVDVGFAGPEFGGGVGKSFAEIQAVVQHDQVRGEFPAFLQHVDKGSLFFLAELAAHRVHFEEVEVVVPAQLDQHVGPRLFLLRRIAETVRSQPDTETATERFGLFGDRPETVRKLFLEALGIDAAVAARSVDGSGVERVDVEIHAVFVMQPFEEFQIGQRLVLGRALVGVVDPREIVAA